MSLPVGEGIDCGADEKGPDRVVITLRGADTGSGDPESPAGDGTMGWCTLLSTVIPEEGNTPCDTGTSF